jgi:hypothetical protein
MLAQRRWTIHTSFVERLTLAFRQYVAAIGQRVNTLVQPGRNNISVRR